MHSMATLDAGEMKVAQPRDWKGMRDMMVRLLQERTGENLDTWNQKIKRQDPKDSKALEVWLEKQGVTGYSRSLLVMERFGYPDDLLASANDLVGAQYKDRPNLRSIYDSIVAATAAVGEVEVQARKTYVSLLTPRRTFARIQPTTKSRVDLGLRIEGVRLGGRLQKSTIHETMQVQIGISSVEEVDSEVLSLLERAHVQNCQ